MTKLKDITVKLIAPKEERRRRLAACLECPHYAPPKCDKCGCFLKPKLTYNKSKCPLNKW